MSDAPKRIDPAASALFLDVDGTLLEICDTPSAVKADEQLLGILKSCYETLGGALALVSGRSVAEVDRIFSPDLFPVAGAHGAEIRADGQQVMSVVDDPLPDFAIAALESFASRHDGLLLERKRGGASLHYRLAPDLEEQSRHLVMDLLRDLGDAYRLIAGKKVFEIAPSAHNKGAAIQWFLENPPFHNRTPVFIGDDVTDEDGFMVVNRLSGTSIRVGNQGQTSATQQLRDTTSVREWLQSAVLNDYTSQTKGMNPT